MNVAVTVDGLQLLRVDYLCFFMTQPFPCKGHHHKQPKRNSGQSLRTLEQTEHAPKPQFVFRLIRTRRTGSDASHARWFQKLDKGGLLSMQRPICKPLAVGIPRQGKVAPISPHSNGQCFLLCVVCRFLRSEIIPLKQVWQIRIVKRVYLCSYKNPVKYRSMLRSTLPNQPALAYPPIG